MRTLRFYAYYIDLLPTDNDWGKAIMLDNKSAVLCAASTHNPYTIRIIGRLSQSWFFNNAREPQQQVSISMVPWTTRTTVCAQNLLGSLSMLVQGQFYPTSIMLKSTEDGCAMVLFMIRAYALLVHCVMLYYYCIT